ncbi:hypothetical protein EKO27_g2108 [Xylaria grammica]|uniref:Uncharacterized protein n=1 Tax=Xylaria grammica TaxID=363999 RepID=A0A439DEY5_9PEZI|nr:hypothetical protein EKO27_g2108 [Xylaria grammica]
MFDGLRFGRCGSYAYPNFGDHGGDLFTVYCAYHDDTLGVHKSHRLDSHDDTAHVDRRLDYHCHSDLGHMAGGGVHEWRHSDNRDKIHGRLHSSPGTGDHPTNFVPKSNLL